MVAVCLLLLRTQWCCRVTVCLLLLRSNNYCRVTVCLFLLTTHCMVVVSVVGKEMVLKGYTVSVNKDTVVLQLFSASHVPKDTVVL